MAIGISIWLAQPSQSIAHGHLNLLFWGVLDAASQLLVTGYKLQCLSSAGENIVSGHMQQFLAWWILVSVSQGKRTCTQNVCQPLPLSHWYQHRASQISDLHYSKYIANACSCLPSLHATVAIIDAHRNYCDFKKYGILIIGSLCQKSFCTDAYVVILKLANLSRCDQTITIQ